jgi:hypothetical protein
MRTGIPNKGGSGITLPGMEEEGAEFIGEGYNLTRVIDQLEKEMREAAANLEIRLGVEKVVGPAD